MTLAEVETIFGGPADSNRDPGLSAEFAGRVYRQSMAHLSCPLGRVSLANMPGCVEKASAT
jgi:hypothetical protein